jgi:hypothetical protein
MPVRPVWPVRSTLACPESRKHYLHKHTREINLSIQNDGGEQEDGKTKRRNEEMEGSYSAVEKIF